MTTIYQKGYVAGYNDGMEGREKKNIENTHKKYQKGYVAGFRAGVVDYRLEEEKRKEEQKEEKEEEGDRIRREEEEKRKAEEDDEELRNKIRNKHLN